MSLRVACGQMCSSSSLAANARVACKLIRLAHKERAAVLFLPEASDYISRDAAHSMELAAATHRDFLEPIQKEIRSIYNACDGSGADRGLCVALGVHEPSATPCDGKSGRTKVQNNQLWIDNQGQIVQRYQKIHLFDVNIANGPILQESKSVEAGKNLVAPFPVGRDSRFKVGLTICYDIRFPETCIALRKHGANIITYPSAFTTKTGHSHWELLGRARAVDSQSFVVMAAQCGEHDVYADERGPRVELESGSGLGLEKEKPAGSESRSKRVSFGRSLIIGPWGDILAECQDYTGRLETDSDGDYYEVCVAELELATVDRIRENMPLMEHRRPFGIAEGKDAR